MKHTKDAKGTNQPASANPPELTKQDEDYLKSLMDSEFQSIDEFDKKIFALAGGAFGVSFAFLKDIVAPGVVVNKYLLVTAWACWCVTLTLNLTSFYFSHLSMRGAQRKYRAGVRCESKLRGFTGNAVMWLNPITGGMFIVGLICMSIFVTTNLYGTGKSKTTATNAPANTATATNAPANTATTTNAPAAGHAGTP